MKNIVSHSSISERFNFLCSLFKTNLLDVKEIKQIVLKASQLPIFFYEYSDPSEWSHFSVMWNGIGLRYGVYSNDSINDLHYIHELFHLINKKIGYADFDTWLHNKIDEEFEASLFSEMSVYVLIPTLRDKTFSFPILIDELDEPTIEDCRKHREETIDCPWANTEAQSTVQKYASNNVLWGSIWKDTAEELEQHMTLVECGECSVEDHLVWLAERSTDGVPFKQKAIDFAEKMAR